VAVGRGLPPGGDRHRPRRPHCPEGPRRASVRGRPLPRGPRAGGLPGRGRPEPRLRDDPRRRADRGAASRLLIPAELRLPPAPGAAPGGGPRPALGVPADSGGLGQPARRIHPRADDRGPGIDGRGARRPAHRAVARGRGDRWQREGLVSPARSGAPRRARRRPDTRESSESAWCGSPETPIRAHRQLLHARDLRMAAALFEPVRPHVHAARVRCLGALRTARPDPDGRGGGPPPDRPDRRRVPGASLCRPADPVAAHAAERHRLCTRHVRRRRGGCELAFHRPFRQARRPPPAQLHQPRATAVRALGCLEWKTDAIEVTPEARRKPGGWRLVYFNDFAIVLVPQPGPSAELAARDGYSLIDPTRYRPGLTPHDMAASFLDEATRAKRQSRGAFIARVMRVHALLELERRAEALEEEKEIVAADPPLYYIFTYLGILRYSAGDHPEAAAHFRRALAIHPRDP